MKLKAWDYGVCVKNPGWSSPQPFMGDRHPVILSHRSSFYTFDCQPHVGEGEPCMLDASSDNPLPGIAHKTTKDVSALSPGVCQTYTPDCTKSPPSPGCLATGPLPGAPWTEKAVGQYLGPVIVGRRSQMNQGYFYYHPGQIPEASKMCVPK